MSRSSSPCLHGRTTCVRIHVVAAVSAALLALASATASVSAASPSLAPYTGVVAQLPGTIRAELFDRGGEGVAYHDTTPGNSGGAFRPDDVDLEPNVEGTFDVGWTAPREWLNYSVSVASSGNYVAQLRVASPSGATMHLGFGAPSSAWVQITIPATGGWQTWTTVTVPVALSAGPQVMTVMFDTAGTNLQSVTVASGSTSTSAPAQTGAFTGIPAAIPGVVEAENFDAGPEGTSYHDTTPGNTTGTYRTTDVDLEVASEGGYDVGWTAPGEWLNYTVNVATAGAYIAHLKVASATGGALHVGFNRASSVWTTVAVPETGGWQKWVTIQVPVTLGAGTQQLTVLFDTAGVNLNSIAVAAAGTTSTSTGSTATVVPVITWNIQINDNSEAHARLAMDLLVQTAPQPEIIVVEEVYGHYINTYIDELQRQTGKTWRGVFASYCAPNTWNGTGCSPWYQGVAIFTTYDIMDTSSILMPYADCWTAARVAVRTALNINGTTVQVFGTHLQSNSCGDMSQPRRSSMSQLKAWAAQYPAPQLMAGDFNGEPSEIGATTGLLPDFIDTWSVGHGNMVTAYGPTPTKKIDYWFVDDSGRAVPQTSEVIYATGATSDHYPVHATIAVK
jgi:endonuclease/exonuclease/phosphatase family metal-dependent hydrolase